jgi:hypothetical protein
LPEPTLKLVRVETADITEERPELTDDIDSTDCFLDKLSASDGLLGGKEGGAFSKDACEGLRGGREGTALSSFSVFSHLASRGAGRTSLAPAGWLPIVRDEATPLLVSGGLFVLSDRFPAGRFGSGGGGFFLGVTAWSYDGGAT